MLPPGYREVLVTDTATAEQWENTCTRLGIDVEIVETTGDDRQRGEWQIGAREEDFARMEVLCKAVASGRVHLPGKPVLKSTAFRALAVVAVLAAIVLFVLIFVYGKK